LTRCKQVPAWCRGHAPRLGLRIRSLLSLSIARVDPLPHQLEAVYDYFINLPRLPEYGALTWKDGDQAPKLGDRLEIYCTNLDQSTNVFDRYYIAQGRQDRGRMAHYGP
jgi:hypothetical protein